MRVYLLLILVYMLASCQSDDEPRPDNEVFRKVVGGNVYTVVGGVDQHGAPGQYLSEEIKIIVRDHDGNIVRTQLAYELSDESGDVIRGGYMYNEDTLTFRWKLGCNELDQRLTIIDKDVCDLYEGQCVEVELFEIGARADGDIDEGWYTPCVPYVKGYTRQSLVSDHRILIIKDRAILSTRDLLNSSWEVIDFASAPDAVFNMLPSGDVFYFDNSLGGKFLSVGSNTWRRSDFPIKAYAGFEITQTANGRYFLITEYDWNVYASDNGIDWVKYADIREQTDDYATIHGSATDGNMVYVLNNKGDVVELNAANGKIETYRFRNASWASYQSVIGDFNIYAREGIIFISGQSEHGHSKKKKLVTLDLDKEKYKKHDFKSAYNMFYSEGQIFIMKEGYEVKKWSDGEFISVDFPKPAIDYNPANVGFHQGKPVLIQGPDSLKIYYYVD